MHIIKKIIIFLNLLIKPKIVKYQGIKLKLDELLISDYIKNIIYRYSYEKEEISILSKVINKEDVVMEIGAGMGFLSIYCSKKSNNKVVAYEANPNMINLIKENYKLNNVNPEIKNIILSDKKGKADFYLEKNFYSSSTLQRTNESEAIEVQTEDINDEINKYNPTFMIIDIEGGEKDLIKKINFEKNHVNKLLLELHPHIIGDVIVNEIIKYVLYNNFILDTAKSGNYVYYFYRTM